MTNFKHIESLDLTIERHLYTGVITAKSYAHGYKKQFLLTSFSEAERIARRELREQIKLNQSTQ